LRSIPTQAAFCQSPTCRCHRSLAVAELAQLFDDIRAGRLESINDKLSFSVVERDVLRPNAKVCVDNRGEVVAAWNA
jgi:hypothetical protein